MCVFVYACVEISNAVICSMLRLEHSKPLTCLHTNINKHINNYVFMYHIHMYIYACMYVCLYICNMCLLVSVQVPASVFTAQLAEQWHFCFWRMSNAIHSSTYLCMCIYTYICVCVYKCVCTLEDAGALRVGYNKLRRRLQGSVVDILICSRKVWKIYRPLWFLCAITATTTTTSCICITIKFCSQFIWVKFFRIY